MKMLITYPNVEILKREFECTPEEAAQLDNLDSLTLAAFIKQKVDASDLPSFEKITEHDLIVDIFRAGMISRPRVLREDAQ